MTQHKFTNTIESYRFGFTGRFSYTFDTLDDLKAEVSRYFTKKEKSIVDQLCFFPRCNFDEYGMAENTYQSYYVIAYLKEVE